jgi:hypothetical protein
MQKARYLVALSCACASVACGTEVAVAVQPRRLDAGVPGIPEKPPPCTSPKILDRLSKVGSVILSEGVRYKRALSFFGMPQDERIALSSSINNTTFIAWLNSSATTVHVTPLMVTTNEIARFRPDYEVPGTELSGLVALEDGFAILTRRTDPGDPLDGGMQQQATHLVRWQNGSELFGVALTGTKSITTPADVAEKRDYPLPNGLSGRLAFNGSHYGAYFGVRGAQQPADRYPGDHADKFVQVDDSGRLVNAWRLGCRQFVGGRLISEATGFVAFCMSDGTIGDPGLNLVEGPYEARRNVRLAFESAPPPAETWGYAGGNFGSAVKTPTGYLVAWASRGVKPNANAANPEAAYESHEPAVALLGNNLQSRPPPAFPFLTTASPAVDAVNVHAAPYGDDKVLLVWETIKSPQFRPGMKEGQGFSTGAYGGTHFRFVDADGKPASVEEEVPEAIAPNGPDDIVRLSNGDLIWAYVPEPARDFQTVISNAELPNLPSISEIRFVRLLYCNP